MIAARVEFDAAAAPLRRAAARLEQMRPRSVVAAFVAVQWLTTLGLALAVRHTGWLFYQGGDQAWFYTTSRLLTQGLLAPTNVGYGWSILLLPFSLAGGPNLVNVLPAIVLLNVLVLMPVAMAAVYGIGERLGGRLFGYWVLILWIALPLIGIAYTDTGFKQRYTELTLPNSFGLTSMSDFPSMVALAVAAYFSLRALQGEDRLDAVLAGAFAGVGIGIKPSSSLFLGGAVLALAGCRRWRGLAAFAAGLAPFMLALTVWKWRGLGYLPLFHAEQGVRLAAGAMLQPMGTLDLHKYLNFNWHQLKLSLDSLQEHFWSARVVEWTLVAGTIALARRGLAPFLLVGGWFWAFLIVKGTGNLGSLETAALLRMLIPTIPAFVVMVAALPLLLPRATRFLSQIDAGPWGSVRLRTTLVAATVILFAAVPIALAGASTPAHKGLALTSSGPIPVDGRIGLQARVSGSRVALTWSPQHAEGAPLFYEVVRAAPGACTDATWLTTCATAVSLQRGVRYVDAPPKGAYDYWVLVGANWINNPLAGDVYLVSDPVAVTVP